MRTLLHMWKGKGALWSFTSCSSGLQQRELGVVGAYQQLWTEPDFCNLAENALLIITAEERVIGPKYSRQHILQTREERGFRPNIQLGQWHSVPDWPLAVVVHPQLVVVLDGQCCCKASLQGRVMGA